MRLLYTLGTWFYGGLLRIAAPFVPKAKLLIQGRNQSLTRIQNFKKKESRPLIWIHCASLGEYEMAVPLIERIQKKNLAIAVSFYSPSGYVPIEKKKNQDLVFYLPLDTPKRMKELVQTLKPKSFILIKYDFWFNLLAVLHQFRVPFHIVNGSFRKNQFMFSPWGKWALNILKNGSSFYVQNQSSKLLLEEKGFQWVNVVKDIRYQRVLDRKKNVSLPDRLLDFKSSKPVLILGSSWPEEEALLAQILPLSEWKIILAPHDVSGKHIQQLRSQLVNLPDIKIAFWTDEDQVQDTDLLILDTIGLLASAYALADAAFVGGGFSGKLHNTLEPAVYGIPLATGPKIQAFPEAVYLKNEGMLDSIKTAQDLVEFLKNARIEERINQARKVANDTFTGLENDIDDMVEVLLRGCL